MNALLELNEETTASLPNKNIPPPEKMRAIFVDPAPKFKLRLLLLKLTRDSPVIGSSLDLGTDTSKLNFLIIAKECLCRSTDTRNRHPRLSVCGELYNPNGCKLHPELTPLDIVQILLYLA